MVFNPDITKQAIEVIFSVKKKKPEHPELLFSGTLVSREDLTKHLGVYLDSGFNFSKHIREAVGAGRVLTVKSCTMHFGWESLSERR